MTDRKALVLGATGGIGGVIADTLIRRGWQVRGMARDVPAALAKKPGLDWVGGDAMTAGDVAAAASGASVIIHAVNPPNYANWDKLVLPMVDNTIAAAKSAGARIVLPGTIYNFDPAKTPVIDADSPQNPRSRKGAIRVALERRLGESSHDAPVLVLRAGDFFGPGVRSSWFSQAMVKPGRPVRRVVNLDRSGGHSWAYLPDLAEALARLLGVPEKLAVFEAVQFAGYCDETGTGIADAIARAAGHAVVRRRFPWWAMHLLSPFGGFPREAAEIAQYWRHPVRLDNGRLEQLIGPEPRTPLDQAVRASLADMGCLPEPFRQAAVAPD
ncbi:MAG: NAD(P)H-binding protein [Paracoccus sp. (in: a-proteobacteria)]|uniref:NAD(P)H-binding protein n=1 Tax=Paracoccus sp. TaxID=267 RepID=UPI0039E671C2